MKKIVSLLIVLMMLLALAPMVLAVELPSGTATAGADSKYTVWFTPEVSGTLSVTVGDGSTNWSSDVMYFDASFSIVTAGSASGSDQATYTAEVSANTNYLIRIWATDGGALSATPYSTAFTEGSGGDGQDPGVTLETYAISDQALLLGANQVQLDSSAYTTVYVFTPGETGVYSVTAPDGVNLGYWGGTTAYVFDATADKTNSLEVTMTDAGQSALIGVSNTDITSTTLTIQKTGDAGLEEYQVVTYENVALGDTFAVPDGAVIGSYVDVYNDTHTAVLGDDGYYHLDSADGDILLVDMDYIFKLSEALTGGRMVMYVPDQENRINYDIGNAVLAYEAACDENGYYPLTEDLIYFYQDYAENAGVYSFCLEDGYNEDCAWMYACLTMHFHSWCDATCILPKTCEGCGATEGDPLGHDDTVCDHICDRCGEDTGVAHADGDDSDHLCDYCGAEVGETCYDEDPVDHICDECGGANVVSHEDGDDNDHLCDHCGLDVGETCYDTDPVDHICDECGVILGSCLDVDTDNDHNCDHCGRENISQHVYVSEVTTPPTCTEPGERISICNCGDRYTEPVRATGHADVDNNNLCDTCDAQLCSEGDHIEVEGSHLCGVCGLQISQCYDAADDNDHLCDICSDPGDEVCADEDRDHKCDICGTELSRCADVLTDADHNCDYCGNLCSNHYYVQTAVVQPTCTTKGYTVFTCNCGDSSNLNETQALGHSWKDATCTDPKTCSACGAVEGDVLEHSWDAGIVTKEPTVEEEGIMTHTCTVCGETKTVTLDKLPESDDPTQPEPTDPTEPEPTDPVDPEPQAGTLNLGDNRIELEMNDNDGETWTFTATESGMLKISVTQLENYDPYTESWNDGTEYLSQLFLRQTYWLNVNGDSNGSETFLLEVEAGDQVTIQLYTFFGYHTKGNLNLAMTTDATEPTDPEPTDPEPTDPEDSEDDNRWEQTWTAQEDGILTLTISGNPGWAYQYLHNGIWSILHTGSGEKTIPMEVLAGETYTFAFRSYSTTEWDFVNGTVSYDLSFEAAEVDRDQAVQDYSISSQELAVGSNPVALDSRAYLTAFVFAPDATGTYTFTAPEGVQLCYYGTTVYPYNVTTAGGQEMTNTVSVTITAVGQSVLIGVNNENLDLADTTVLAEKTAEYVEQVVELEVYENQHEPSDFEVPGTATVGEYVDVYGEDHTAVLGEDGYYHLDSEDGPILLVDMDHIAVLTDALKEGRGIMYAYVLGDDGSILAKYDIEKAIKAYEKKADENGYYPLTADLIFFYDTYAAGSGTYEFFLEDGYNPQCAWMFACVTMTVESETITPNPPATGDTSVSLAAAVLLVSAMSILALPKTKKYF